VLEWRCKEKYALTSPGEQMEQVPAYYADLSTDLTRAMIPEDFADWLMDNGREQEARAFLHNFKMWLEETPEVDQTPDAIIELCEEYAPVVVFNAQIRQPKQRNLHDALKLIQDLEEANEPTSKTPALSWDQEAAIINQMLADEAPEEEPEDEVEPEFVLVTAYVDDGDTILGFMGKVFIALIEEGYSHGARDFIREVGRLLNLDAEPFELYCTAMTYVHVRAEPGSKAWYKERQRS
jgi:hypothetical protein